MASNGPGGVPAIIPPLIHQTLVGPALRRLHLYPGELMILYGPGDCGCPGGDASPSLSSGAGATRCGCAVLIFRIAPPARPLTAPSGNDVYVQPFGPPPVRWPTQYLATLIGQSAPRNAIAGRASFQVAAANASAEKPCCESRPPASSHDVS